MIYCGIDGGQTSTKCVIGTESGALVGAGRGGPLIHLSAAGGREQFADSIMAAIDDAWRKGGRTPEPIRSIVVGATGVFEDTIEVRIATDVLSPLLPHSLLTVCSDALIALVGAHAGSPGIMVISGTGTIAYGTKGAGNDGAGSDGRWNTMRAGGWGWPLGDEGSAYAIGRAGLRAALYASDGMGDETTLLGLMLAHFKVDDPQDIKRLYFGPEFGAAGFAALAPLVSEASSGGDAVATQIIVEQGQALARQAQAVANRLNLDEAMIRVAPVGGAFQHIHGLREAMEEALIEMGNSSQQRLMVSPPRLPPQSGAFLMALQQNGQPMSDSIISRVESWTL